MRPSPSRNRAPSYPDSVKRSHSVASICAPAPGRWLLTGSLLALAILLPLRLGAPHRADARPLANTPNTWTGLAGNSQWGTLGNWSENSVPISTDDVVIATPNTIVNAEGGLNAGTLAISA